MTKGQSSSSTTVASGALHFEKQKSRPKTAFLVLRSNEDWEF